VVEIKTRTESIGVRLRDSDNHLRDGVTGQGRLWLLWSFGGEGSADFRPYDSRVPHLRAEEESSGSFTPGSARNTSQTALAMPSSTASSAAAISSAPPGRGGGGPPRLSIAILSPAPPVDEKEQLVQSVKSLSSEKDTLQATAAELGTRISADLNVLKGQMVQSAEVLSRLQDRDKVISLGERAISASPESGPAIRELKNLWRKASDEGVKQAARAELARARAFWGIGYGYTSPDYQITRINGKPVKEADLKTCELLVPLWIAPKLALDEDFRHSLARPDLH
jgi:hypothetical protein